jgi:hypothetical protein
MVTQVKWNDPTTNVDGSLIASGEITGYTVGVRLQSGTAGTYPYSVTAPSTAVTELLSALTPVLPTSVALVAAVQAVSSTNGNSAWSVESASFQLTAAPNAPTGVSVA